VNAWETGRRVVVATTVMMDSYSHRDALRISGLAGV
jgi:hypothetical protein